MKLFTKSSISLATLLMASGFSLFADSITTVGTSSAGWQQWSVSQISNQPWQTSQQTANQPFWNNSSWDGTNDNVGGCLAVASSGCALANQPGALSYLAQANGKAVSNFYFVSNGGPVTISMQMQDSAGYSAETFGWYNVNNPSQYQVLFSGKTNPGTTITFTPSADYGFFLYNGFQGVNAAFATNSNLNNDDAGYQHFAVFQQTPGVYYMGVEDLPANNTDFDYNDMIVKMSTTATPEPASMLLFGAGLIGFGIVGLRRKNTKA